MASQHSRINRSTSELKSFLEYYRDEYEGAYQNIRPNQGWNIPYRADYVFHLLENMHGNMYDSIHPLLFKDDPTPDEEILDRLKALLAYLELQEKEFADIAAHSDEKVLDVTVSTVYGLFQKLRYKLREVVQLGDIDITAKSVSEVPQVQVATPSENPVRLVGIVTATLEEEQAVKNLMCSTPIPSAYNAQDSSTYYTGEFQKGNKIIPVVLVRTHHQGIAAATNTTTKLLLKYQPSFIVMLGHAAGNKNMMHAHLGDILIANESVDYHQVELVQRQNPETGETEFAERDKKYHIHIEAGLQSRLSSVSQRTELINQIKEDYPDKSLFEKPISCRMGKFVTGGVLMRSEERLKQILSENPGTFGLDMETHGFYYACSNTTIANKPLFVSIKSISDFGEHNTTYSKNTRPSLVRQKFATYTSATFFHQFLFEAF